MTPVLHALTLTLTLSMAWSILWALVFGFFLSAIAQSVVRRDTVTSLLGDDHPRSLAVATGLGMAASSCSYAAVALARSLFGKGRQLHRGDGVRDSVHEPGDRSRA